MIVSQVYTPQDIEDARSDDLRDSKMMRHLLKALEAGISIGDYGRLAFVMVARYYLDEHEMVSLLASQPELDGKSARALVSHILEKGYIPPTPEIIRIWQQYQDFPICPGSEDPESCNVYLELRFPGEVYTHLSQS